MCGSDLPPGDRRAVGSHKIGTLFPGDMHELTMAWTHHPQTAWPCNIGTTLADVQSLQALYAADFSGVCSPLIGVAEGLGQQLKIKTNPADGEFTIEHAGLNLRHLRLLTAEGRLVREITDLEGGQTRVSTAGLPNGLYVAQAVTDRGAGSVKVMVQH